MLRAVIREMEWFSSLFHRSALVRVAIRGVVLSLTAFPLIVIALKLQPHMPILSFPAVIVVIAALVLAEATVVVAIKWLFRRVQ